MQDLNKSVTGVTQGIGHAVSIGGRNMGKTALLKEQIEEREKPSVVASTKKRINELKWPASWTRNQKRKCVAACKRAIKKGYIQDGPKWNAELAKAGFKKS